MEWFSGPAQSLGCFSTERSGCGGDGPDVEYARLDSYGAQGFASAGQARLRPDEFSKLERSRPRRATNPNGTGTAKFEIADSFKEV